MSYLATCIEYASNFHYLFAYFGAFELYVVYTRDIIDIRAQQSFIRQKIDEVLFFFKALAATNQPAPGPAFWSWNPFGFVRIKKDTKLWSTSW